MRRIALYSDVHGNVAALEAVSADIREQGLSERYCLGDLVGLGPRPNESVMLVSSYGDAAVQGNYDRAISLHLGTPGGDFPTPQEELDGAEAYAFTISEIGPATAAFVASLPPSLVLEHGGVRIVLCHGVPDSAHDAVGADERPMRILELVRSARADVVCAGHVHVPFHRSVPDASGVVHWVNAGSVGRPRDGDPRAAWVEVVLGDHHEVVGHTPADMACRRVGTNDVWLGVLVHRVAYDVDAVVRDMTHRGLPHTLAVGLRTGREEHDLPAGERPHDDGCEASPPAEFSAPVLPCGHAPESCSCLYDDRIAAYEALARLYRGDIAEVAAAVRRLRIAMRSCRINRHVDEAAIVEAFEDADMALRTSHGRASFEIERERLYGLHGGFDPFVNVLSPQETTYLSGDSHEHVVEIQAMYADAAFLVPEIAPAVRIPDHITTELSFMAHCLRGAAAGDDRALQRARLFFSRHLGDWAVLFAVVVGQQATEPVMRYAGRALDKFLTCEGAFLRHDVADHEALRSSGAPGRAEEAGGGGVLSFMSRRRGEGSER